VDDPRLGIVIVTYQRPASLARLLDSIRTWSPVEYERTVVVDQTDPPIDVPRPVVAVRHDPGFPGPRRRYGASYLRGADGASTVEALLFLDDDAELLRTWATDRARLLARVLTGRIGLVSLPLRDGWPTQPRAPVVGMSGGMLVRAEAYWDVRGHGEDYLDDIELSLRLRWRGWRIVRWHRKVSRHHIGISGGLRALVGVEAKRQAHLRLSRLADIYPEHIVRSPWSWWGHRERRHG
jgi:GT2 family glycosyltransferase